MPYVTNLRSQGHAARGRRLAIASLSTLLAFFSFSPPTQAQQATTAAVTEAECRSLAEEDVAPGLYMTVYEGGSFVQRGDELLELEPGDAGFVDERLLSCLEQNPEFFLQDVMPRPSLILDAVCGVGSSESWRPFGNFRAITDQRQAAVTDLLRRGYPPYSVLLHLVGLGMTVGDAIFLTVKAQPERTDFFVNAAIDLLPYMPGWVCGTARDSAKYAPVYAIEELPSENRTIAEVAKRFFEDNRRLGPSPFWRAGDANLNASLSELVELAGDQYWYRPGPPTTRPGGNPREVVFVSLYREGQQIVLDWSLERLEAARASGLTSLPVVFLYNERHERPVSGFGADVTLQEVADAHFGRLEELTSVPELRVGDHHLLVSMAQWQETVDIPEREAIDPERYEALLGDVRENGFTRRPMAVTLLSESRTLIVDEPARLRAAAELGMTELPTVVFYHGTERLDCAAPTDCIDRLVAAAECAGAGAAVTVGGAAAPAPGTPPGGGGGAVTPPPVPPPPPVAPPPPILPPPPPASPA